MNKKWIVAILAALVLVAVGGWAAGLFDGTDPKVAELEQLRDESFKRADDLSDEERRVQMEGFREKVQDLNEDQRREFMESSRPIMQQFFIRQMHNFFEKTPEEQQADLDQWIDRMEQFRKAREAAGNQDGPGGGPGGGPGNRQNLSPQQRDQWAKQMLDRTSPELRAMATTFFSMLNERRQERGLEPIEGPPR